MNEKRIVNQEIVAGLTIGDVYYTLFRQKWKIILLTVLGIAGAIYIKYNRPPTYKSEAQLYVKYINSDRPISAGVADNWTPIAMDPGIDGKLKTEAAILKSFDMSLRVVTNVGPDKVLAHYGGGTDRYQAASIVCDNITIDRVFGSSTVMSVSLSLMDRDLVQSVLQDLIDSYRNQHAKIHSQASETYEALVRTAEDLNSQRAEADEEYRKAKKQAGVIDYDDKRKFDAMRVDQITQSISDTQILLGACEATLLRLKVLTSTNGSLVDSNSTVLSETNAVSGTNVVAVAAASTTNKIILATAITNAAAVVSSTTNSNLTSSTNAGLAALLSPAGSAAGSTILQEKLEEYKRTCSILDRMRKDYDERLGSYNKSNPIMVEKQSNIERYEQMKKDMEKEEPRLVSTSGGTGKDFAGQLNEQIAARELRIVELNATIDGYKAELVDVQGQITNLALHEANISEKGRRLMKLTRDCENIQTTLDQAKIESDLAAIHNANINVTQSPTPPTVENSKTPKFMGMAASLGLLGGLSWAFITELLLDHSVRRAKEIEADMNMRLFLTIPRVNRKNNRRRAGRFRKKEVDTAEEGSLLPALNGMAHLTNGSMEIAPWDHRHTLHDYFEALRDRLITYFEVNNLTHKPKLVAVTGSSEGCGATTLAVGLAASLSETGDGSVLLVDMNLEHGAAQHFYQGTPSVNLDVALAGDTKQNAQVFENLYVVGGNKGDRLSSMLPKRFANLLPKLQSSDYDYIIFDMPAVARTGVTQRLAGFMDMMLLVVESEKTQRHVLRQASSVLNESKAKVSVVLNKTRTFVPPQLHQEF